MCRFRVFFRCLCIAVIASLAFLPKSSNAQSHPDGFVYVEGEYLMLNGERFILKGYNYLPRDYGWTSMADWDWEAVDEEFALAKAYGANTIRTGFHTGTAIGNLSCEKALTFKEVRPEYLEAIGKLVHLAKKHDLRLILWLGDLCPQFLSPAYEPGLKKYIQSIVPLFADEPYIIAWDLQTDVDGFVLQRPPVGCYGALPYCTKANMLDMLRRMAETIRELDPNHLITVGFCWPTSSLLAQDFTDFLMPQVLGGDAPQILTGEGPADELEGYGAGAGLDRETMIRTLEEKFLYMQSHLTRPMPIVVAEYGSPSAGDIFSPELQQQIYDAALEVFFLRMKLAGALNWALTDFTWPPKAQPFAFLDRPLAVTEQNFGAFYLDYSPKPAAEVAKAYYADAPTIAFQDRPEALRFVFSDSFVPGPEDTRVLTIAFDYIAFLAEDGSTLLKIDIGDPSARVYLASGFSGDEGPWGNEAENFVWASGEEKVSRVVVPFPEGTSKISFRATNELSDMKITVFVEEREVAVIAPKLGWGRYAFELPEEEPLKIGSTYTLRGKFNIPISEGTVTVQASDDQITWQDVASVVPAEGRFSASIPIERGGTMWLRAVWSGAGLYQEAISKALPLEIPSPPATPTVTPLPAAASPTPLPVSAPGASLGLYVGVGVLLLVVGMGIFFALRRKRSKAL